MVKEKKPDNVVFNTETQKYDAYLKPYATSVGAPIILLRILLLGKTGVLINLIIKYKLGLKKSKNNMTS